MASVKKFKQSAVMNQLRHLDRSIQDNANQDIDDNRSFLNYSLAPDRGVTAYDYFIQRKSELYVYNRADVVMLAGWVVTAPKELKTPEDIATFFNAVNQFFNERYGVNNCIASTVHLDETTPHLHYCFMPTVKDKNVKHNEQGFYDKLCANDVLNKKEMRNFHPDLQRYLDSNTDLKVNVNTGITKAQGGNRTVKEMKQERDMQITRQVEVERGRWY